MLFRAAVSGLCVAQVFGTGEHGALMQSQANTEDLDAILLANADSSEKPRLSTKHHLSHTSHERSRAKLAELQHTAESLEQKYKAILHAKVEKTKKTGGKQARQQAPEDGNFDSAAPFQAPDDSKDWKGNHAWAPSDTMFNGIDALLEDISKDLIDQAAANRALVAASKAVLEKCNDDRRYEFDLPRYMDYYYYMKTIKFICSNFDSCWDEAQDNWVKLRINTEDLEKTQKLIYKVIRKARCYVEHIKQNTPDAADIAQCVTLDAPTEHLDIVYDPEIVRDPCDLCSFEEGMGDRGSRAENMEKWAIRHHKTPQDGIVNSAKIMYQVLESTGLMDQHAAEQAEVYRNNDEVNMCNTIKEAKWLSENTDTLKTNSETAGSTHTTCRTTESGLLTDMQSTCNSFREARSSCNWPYWFAAEGGNESLAATKIAAQDCYSKIKDTNPTSKDCDLKQGVYENEFCTYYWSKNNTCWDHQKCYDRETQERDLDIAWIKKREHSLKLQHRMVKMNLCFIDKYQGATNATTAVDMKDEDLHGCVDDHLIDDSHLDIKYPDPEPQAPCDVSDIEFHPGQDSWEELKYDMTPFTDKWNSMNGITSCSFDFNFQGWWEIHNATTGLIQKMRATKPKSMRSP